jgi:hypothetical protein
VVPEDRSRPVILGLRDRCSRRSAAGRFDNLQDSEAGLREILAASFAEVQLDTVGSIALFAAATPRRHRSAES